MVLPPSCVNTPEAFPLLEPVQVSSPIHTKTHSKDSFQVTNRCKKICSVHVTTLSWRRRCFYIFFTTSLHLHQSFDWYDRPLRSHPCYLRSSSWTKKSSVKRRKHQHFSPSLLPSTWYSSLNLGSPQTTHHHYVWLWMGDESCWPCLWFWGSSSSRLCVAAWGWAAWDYWYWVERSAPGTIHQKGAVCTVGIDMNNPCFLYPFLCYYAYPIKFSVAFSSNIQLLYF